MTMIFYSLCELIETKFGRKWGTIEASLDDNWGCLASAAEDDLQKKLKQIQRVDNFKKYYKWIGVACPDDEALATRLRRAITNSKAKKYHGSSEHMNELPKLDEQAVTHLMADPSPFAKYNDADKTFTAAGADPFWRKACIEKFDWVNREINNGARALTAAQVALKSDELETESHVRQDVLADELMAAQQPGNVITEIQKSTVYEDYPASFTWRQLYHKLCFE